MIYPKNGRAHLCRDTPHHGTTLTRGGGDPWKVLVTRGEGGHTCLSSHLDGSITRGDARGLPVRTPPPTNTNTNTNTVPFEASPPPPSPTTTTSGGGGGTFGYQTPLPPHAMGHGGRGGGMHGGHSHFVLPPLSPCIDSLGILNTTVQSFVAALQWVVVSGTRAALPTPPPSAPAGQVEDILLLQLYFACRVSEDVDFSPIWDQFAWDKRRV